MLNRKRFTLILVSLLLCFPLTAAALQKGEAFPTLVGETLSGAHFNLDSLKGKPILLKIGTTWCGTCRMQSKTINELRGFMGENGVHYVEVFIQESSKKVKQYFSDRSYQLPDTSILDNGDISKKLNVYLIPRIILIDRDFKVYRDGDTISKKNLKKQLQAILAEQ